MTDLQALVTGAIAGALSRSDVLNVEVRVHRDARGNYLPYLDVIGNESGRTIRVHVEEVE